MMCDSTNVLKPGYTMSEKHVGKRFDNIFAENKEKNNSCDFCIKCKTEFSK